MKAGKMTVILDYGEVEKALLLRGRLLAGPEMFRSKLLRDKGWSVVPVESASHFNSQDVRRLSSAIRSLGFVDCLAIIADEVTEGPMVYRVPITEDGLASFSQECLGLNALLVPQDEAFAVLCTVDDYYLVAGQRNFVAAATGGDISKAREAFSSFANRPAWPDDMRRFLMNIATIYSSFEG
jgi:hypothetical protein